MLYTLIKRKDEVTDCFKGYIMMASPYFGQSVTGLMCDNDRIHISDELKKMCSEKGIVLKYSNLYTSSKRCK